MKSSCAILLAVSLLLWVAIAKAEDSTSPVLRVGFLLPPEQEQSADMLLGARAAVEIWNQSNLPRAELLIRGRTGQWGADATEGARLATDDGVVGLVASPGREASHLALQVAGRTALPVVSLCPDSSVTGTGIPWMVRVVPGTFQEASNLLAYVNCGKQLRGSWSAIVPEGRRGREKHNDLHRAAEVCGVSLTVHEMTSSSLLLERVMKEKPVGVLLWISTREGADMVKALRRREFKGILAGPSWFKSRSFLSASSSAAEGFLISVPELNEQTETVPCRSSQNIVETDTADASAPAEYAFDAVTVLLKTVGPTGASPSHKRFPSSSRYSGASGELIFDTEGNRTARLQVLQFRSGRFTSMTDPAKN